jgi:hypothetical protein
MEADRFLKVSQGESAMFKVVVAAAAAVVAVSGAAFAGPIHTQSSVQEIVVVAYDKKPLSERYAANVTRSLATMDIRLRTELAKTSYARNEAAISASFAKPAATALAFIGS